jgi:hypothetical protein
MVRELKRALLLALLILAAGSASAQDNARDSAQDEALQRVYARLEDNVRVDYEALRNQLAMTAMRFALNAAKEREELKTLSYNKAVIFAACAVESERDRPPTANRVPAEQNIVLRTCVEIKFNAMEKFSNRLAYAEVFFPERIERCGDDARLRAQEKLLPPYAFLELAEPKLYDFARYNECLMAPPPEPTGAVSRRSK